MSESASPPDDRTRAALDQALTFAVRTMSTLSVLHSQAVAERVGIHSTDMECLDLLNIHGPLTAGRLAALTGLSTGAITRLVDRLERAGYARREPDPADRRRVVIHVNMEHGMTRIFPYFAPLVRRMAEIWAEYSDAEIALMADFVGACNAAVQDAIAGLRDESSSPATALGHVTKPAPSPHER